MKVKIQHQLHSAMAQFGFALTAGQLDVASGVCRTLRFLGDNIDLPMVRERFTEASQILDQREQSFREEVNLLVRDCTRKSDFDAVKAHQALDLIDTLDELFALDLARNRSSAAIAVRAFLQAELQKLVGNLLTLNGDASREPPVEKAQDWLTMLSSWTAAGARKVASEMTTEHEMNPFKMLAEEGVAEVNGFVSRLVGEVDARLGDDQVLELFYSQGLLDRVRPGARKWQLLGVFIDGIEENCEVAVTRLEAVLTLLSVDSEKSLCRTATLGRNPKQSRQRRKDQHPSGSAPHSSRRWLTWSKT